MKEARSRIKINKALEASGWRFFDSTEGAANMVLEPNVKLTEKSVNDLGEDFQKVQNGFVDFLLLDETGRPLAVLEAKAESKDPLIGKEQARKYARSQNCRFVILSNGNLHYFWDLDRGNPHIITGLPKPGSMLAAEKLQPNPDALVSENVEHDYIVLTQRPGYANEAGWKNESEREEFVHVNRLKFLRDYQVRAVRSLQSAVGEGKDRFLFEMATGTGKTLTAAAIIKLFLRTRNANRVLFLVDRLELEEQARKAFQAYLANDAKTVIYKESRDDWRHADIAVSTVQSLLFDNKYPFVVSALDRRSADHWDHEGPAVCIPIVSSAGHGKADIKRIHYQDGQFALATTMCGLRVKDGSNLNPRFLHIYLEAAKRDILIPLMCGATNVTLDSDHMLEVLIPIPEPHIQDEVVERYLVETTLTEITARAGFLSATTKRPDIQSLAQAIVEDASAFHAAEGQLSSIKEFLPT